MRIDVTKVRKSFRGHNSFWGNSRSEFPPLTTHRRSHLMKPDTSCFSSLARLIDLEVREERRRFFLEHAEAGHRHPPNLQLGPFA